MAIVVTKEEKILREKRHKQFVYLLDKYKVRTRKLALLTGIEENNLSSYKSGKQPITEHTMERIMRGFEMLDQELLINKPNVEVEDWDYVLQQLKLHGNVVIRKNKIKDIDKYMVDLKLNGLTCTYSTDRDGDYVVTDSIQHKPMVEKVIQDPKPVIESDPSIISKVRNLHADSIVMHGEAIKLQESTEQLVKGMDEFDSVGSVTVNKEVLGEIKHYADQHLKLNEKGDVKYSKEPLNKQEQEKILTTDEDIKEVVESKKACYQPSEEEKEELKELAEEVMSNLGIEKGIHTVDFVEFLETRMPKQEVRGYLRGKAIECLFEEDYHSAVICIEYFLDNGYAEVEA